MAGIFSNEAAIIRLVGVKAMLARAKSVIRNNAGLDSAGYSLRGFCGDRSRTVQHCYEDVATGVGLSA